MMMKCPDSVMLGVEAAPCLAQHLKASPFLGDIGNRKLFERRVDE